MTIRVYHDTLLFLITHKTPSNTPTVYDVLTRQTRSKYPHSWPIPKECSLNWGSEKKYIQIHWIIYPFRLIIIDILNPSMIHLLFLLPLSSNYILSQDLECVWQKETVCVSHGPLFTYTHGKLSHCDGDRKIGFLYKPERTFLYTCSTGNPYTHTYVCLSVCTFTRGRERASGCVWEWNVYKT